MGAGWMPTTWWILAVVTAAAFVDTPLRTFGQRFLVRRNRERLVMLSLELDLLALWAVAEFYLRWRTPLVPGAMAGALGAAGLLVAAAGFGLAVWAKLRLGRWFSGTFGVKEGHELVTDGPYAVTRHPIYTGLVAGVAGGALVANDALTLLLAALLLVPFFFHTVYEEAMFERHFGAAYLAYEQRVPRLVPFLKPGPARRA